MEILIKNHFSIEQLEEMKKIYHLVGWNRHNKEIIKQIFENSNLVAVATIDGKVVGFGRVLTDGIFNAAIYDVVVHPDFQKQGIARNILNNLLENLNHISCIHLIATTGNEDFYRKCGFKKLKTGMARYHREDLDREYLE